MTVLCHLELCDTPIETLVGSFQVETFGLKTSWAWGQAQASWGTVEPSNTRSDLRLTALLSITHVETANATSPPAAFCPCKPIHLLSANARRPVPYCSQRDAVSQVTRAGLQHFPAVW